MAYEQLKLENQLCFPVYAASRLITREYQPYLEKLGITYPQYLVLMILWENDRLPVTDIARKLILNTNTITPLLKRMEQTGLIARKRSPEDERKVMIELTDKGRAMQEEAARIPEALVNQLMKGDLKAGELTELKSRLTALIRLLSANEPD
ncbi:MAG: MarR family transcriptional regulator [Lentimicrobium sp.]|jgi:DNA-binding MarR family transcriptional regulator|uniref:MarR family winged helix-turn-helix transcriptional regulator n=1 Tax=Lentimicrobium sp. TaxID=2034841 RepID=UPI0025E946FC|nr:MarR family transcriptional regulator [Lentimicrobium sp.]MCO5256708.1 MarR family transcriptional regulator [Lentimicrobium sp.]MCO5263041.1 MarR family transcriptional regulator [Lentimicrobium sp.]HOP12675.1 MarR family transcriptional regulator [Lentimicrobium sp.]